MRESLQKMFSAVVSGRHDEEIMGHIEAYHLGYYERLRNAVKSDYPAAIAEGRNICHSRESGNPTFDSKDWIPVSTGMTIQSSVFTLGDDIDKYITQNPPHSWDLNIYAHNFWEIIEQENIRELAKLEAMIHIVFWLPDSEALQASDLANLTEEEFAALSLQPRTALKIFASEYLVNDYLTAFREGKQDLQLHKGKQYILLVRHENEVRRHILEAEEYNLLQKLFSGETFADALGDNAELIAKIGEYLQKWLVNGFFQKGFSNNLIATRQ